MRIFFSVNHSGCAWWRVRQPAEMIQKLGLAEVVMFSQVDTSREELETLINWANVVVGQSAAGVISVALVMKYKEMGKITVMDYDDLVYACSPLNPAYRTLGTREVKIKNIQGEEVFLWKDGVGGFSLNDNRMRYLSQQDILALTDIVTTTNEYLKDKYEAYLTEQKEKIFILPNSIDFDLFVPFPKKDTNKIRIGWTPSSSHFAEIFMVRDILVKLFKKYPENVEMVILGDLMGLKEYFKDKIEYHPFIDLAVYPLKFASLNLDIGICPLEDNEFNLCKSQLKWSEFSSLKVPCVVSDLMPYSCVEEGITGLKAKTTDEWVDKLSMLIDNSKLRNGIADNAWQKNYDDFNLEKNITRWVKAYEGKR